MQIIVWKVEKNHTSEPPQPSVFFRFLSSSSSLFFFFCLSKFSESWTPPPPPLTKIPGSAPDGGHILDLTARVPTGVRREEGDKDYWRGGMGRDVKRPNPPFQTLNLCTMVTFVYRKTPPVTSN